MDCTESSLQSPVLETATAPVVKRDKSKIENIQGLRGLAAMLVVFCHIGRYESAIFPSRALLPHMEPLGDAGVDLFFVINGFVMVTITQGQFKHYSGALTFFLRRAARIYPLYWFYTLLYLPLFLFRPGMMNRPGGSEGINLTKSFLLLPSPVAPLIGQGWTLIHEMYFYLVFALILLSPKNFRPQLLAAWTLVIVGAWCMGTGVVHNSATLALIFNPMTLEFLAGCAMAWFVVRGCTRFPRLTLLLGTGLFTATLCMGLPWHRVALHLVPFSLLGFGATSEWRQVRDIVSRDGCGFSGIFPILCTFHIP